MPVRKNCGDREVGVDKEQTPSVLAVAIGMSISNGTSHKIICCISRPKTPPDARRLTKHKNIC